MFDAESGFSIDDPDPQGLEANIRISLGFIGFNRGFWTVHSHPELDLEEYKKALALEPDSPLANVAYAVGLYRAGFTSAARYALLNIATKFTGDARNEADAYLRMPDIQVAK